jgi:hypothetical protein
VTELISVILTTYKRENAQSAVPPSLADMAAARGSR